MASASAVGVARPEQHTINPRGNELDERAVLGRDRGSTRGHGLDDNEAEGFLPGGGYEDRTRPGHQFEAPAGGDMPDHLDGGPRRRPGRHLALKWPCSGYDQAQARVTGHTAVTVPGGHQQA